MTPPNPKLSKFKSLNVSITASLFFGVLPSPPLLFFSSPKAGEDSRMEKGPRIVLPAIFILVVASNLQHAARLLDGEGGGEAKASALPVSFVPRLG